MQLRSLVSVGLGGTIPQVQITKRATNYASNKMFQLLLCLQVNQLLSLFFIIMVQVVITTEWYVINMPLQTKVIFFFSSYFQYLITFSR